jgi:hypothetical protein
MPPSLRRPFQLFHWAPYLRGPSDGDLRLGEGDLVCSLLDKPRDDEESLCCPSSQSFVVVCCGL